MTVAISVARATAPAEAQHQAGGAAEPTGAGQRVGNRQGPDGVRRRHQ
jgi:hypothetical protein